MKRIKLSKIKNEVKKAVQDANFILGEDVKEVIKNSIEKEESLAGKDALTQIIENVKVAFQEKLGLCQDTGIAVFFVEMGEDVRFIKDNELKSIREAITSGMIEGYKEGYLRKSLAEDPLRRKNTGDNSPAFIHWEIVPGDKFKITFIAKGGGAENMSAIRMFAPAAGLEGVENFVVETVSEAGSNPCPPVIVGVGIGGNFETSALLAKKALLRRPVGSHNPDPFYKDMEERLLKKVNNLGIGPLGLGGRITALAVHVESYPCHIASLPCAVNIECHSHRVVELEF
ncbi:MAG: fumarate hydratase [Acidobacteriota bacterium]